LRRAIYVFGLVTLVATGCQGTKGTQTASSDPLMGEKTPERPYGVAGPTPPPQNRAGMSSGQPQATASKSNAAMLMPDPLTGGKSIGIPDGDQPPAATTGGWQAKDPQPGNPGGPGVTLRTPEPVPVPIQHVPPPSNVPGTTPAAGAVLQPAPTPAPVPTVVATPTAPTPQVVSPVAFTEPDPLQSALKTRGVIWQDQKTESDGVHFTCRVANSQDPNFVRVYEAVGHDYRTAVQAVLEQIDQKR
jgi:hypothetical protein